MTESRRAPEQPGHGSQQDEAAESHWDTANLCFTPFQREDPRRNHIWSFPGADVVEGGFDVYLEQQKLKQFFHPSIKVKSQPLFFPGKAWRAPQFILDVLGRAFPGGWLGARSSLL